MENGYDQADKRDARRQAEEVAANMAHQDSVRRTAAAVKRARAAEAAEHAAPEALTMTWGTLWAAIYEAQGTWQRAAWDRDHTAAPTAKHDQAEQDAWDVYADACEAANVCQHVDCWTITPGHVRCTQHREAGE